MIRFKTLYLVLGAIACSFNSGVAQAGDCGCSGGQSHFAPMAYADHGSYADPGMDVGCDCAMAASSCCGVGGGGLAQLGSLYGSVGVYGGYHGSANPRGFESGFESLPNMDGGGVHHRLPFHSYRRPWAHPGIADNNINIVW